MSNTIKYLFGTGCSFTHGAGLGKVWKGYWDPKDVDRKYQYENTWGNLLAKKLKVEWIPKSQPGSSNDWSYRHITDFLFFDERANNSIIIWQLTALEREERWMNGNFFTDESGANPIIIQANDGGDYTQNVMRPYLSENEDELVDRHEKLFVDSGVTKKERKLMFKTYWKYFYNDYYRAYDLLRNIYLISSLCELRGIKFLVFDAFPDIKLALNKEYDGFNNKLYEDSLILHKKLVESGTRVEPFGKNSWDDWMHHEVKKEEYKDMINGIMVDPVNDGHPGLIAHEKMSEYLFNIIN